MLQIRRNQAGSERCRPRESGGWVVPVFIYLDLHADSTSDTAPMGRDPGSVLLREAMQRGYQGLVV